MERIQTLAQIERAYILEVLHKFKGNFTAVSAALGISRAGLYSKMRRYKIDESRGVYKELGSASSAEGLS
jgi:DNA-binding NtrC family response regulator